MEKQRVAESPARRWTRAEDYLSALARRRTARRGRDDARPRTQPEAPRLLLSTVPFLALIAMLGVLAVAIMIAAFPGAAPQPASIQLAQHEQGVAAKGWFQEAEREMHH